ncbi:Cloroperoxidase [Marasmius fiardii PR-910]|nr:Cloroperoxidase [Marasmius fiardii PR-910]
MSSYGAFFSTDPKTHSITDVPQHPPISDSNSNNKCPMWFAHGSLSHQPEDIHEYRPPKKSDIRSVCPALNTMANHGYIPRDGRNLTFFTIFYGLKACYGLSSFLAFVLAFGGFILIGRSPISLPFTVPKLFAASNPDGSTSQPGVIDLRLVGLHGGVEHDASLVHEDCSPGKKYPNREIRQDMVGNLVGDVLPEVKGYPRSTSCGCLSHVKDLKEGPGDGDMSLSSSISIISRLGFNSDPRRRRHSRESSSSSETVVSDDEDEGWRQYATKQYMNTLVSAADVGRMRARREREIAPKKMDGKHAEIARGEMAIILGVWERSAMIKEDGKVKKGIPLPYLLTWLAEERLPEGWKPDHVQGLWNVVMRSWAIRTASNSVVKARSY